MKSLTAVLITILLVFLQTGLVGAQGERNSEERIRNLEEELGRIREEIGKKMKSDTKELISSLPFKLKAGLTLRYDSTKLEDQADLLLGDNEIDGLRTRIRFSIEYNQNGRLSGGLRLSTGENPNPTSAFIRTGSVFQSRSFNIDQFYIVYRPLKLHESLAFTVGKVPQPFWRGDRGTWRDELIWDDDINPEGVVLQATIPTGVPYLDLHNTVGYFTVYEATDDRFAGLTGDVYLWGDQLKLAVTGGGKGGGTIAVAIYDYRNLNAGLMAPNFTPGSGGVVSPGTNAFLLREGFQRTNNRINLGPGAEGFMDQRFSPLSITGQVHLSLPTGWLEPIGMASLEPEVFWFGDYVKNINIHKDNKGYGLTGGLRGGGKVAPFNIWYTWRDIDADATLATFADSDLGGGTAFKGYEIGANYLIQADTMVQVSFFNFEGFPLKDNGVTRWFVDVVRTF